MRFFHMDGFLCFTCQADALQNYEDFVEKWDQMDDQPARSVLSQCYRRAQHHHQRQHYAVRALLFQCYKGYQHYQHRQQLLEESGPVTFQMPDAHSAGAEDEPTGKAWRQGQKKKRRSARGHQKRQRASEMFTDLPGTLPESPNLA